MDYADDDEPWIAKAREIAARYSHEAWRQANFDKTGKRYKRRRPYAVPAIAEALVKAIGLPDRTAREHECKRLFEVERLGAWSMI